MRILVHVWSADGCARMLRATHSCTRRAVSLTVYGQVRAAFGCSLAGGLPTELADQAGFAVWGRCVPALLRRGPGLLAAGLGVLDGGEGEGF